MGLTNEGQSNLDYVNIIGSTGKFHQQVDESTEGAIKREYETSDGKKGEKRELRFNSLRGKIDGLFLHDGDYGTNIKMIIDGVMLSVGTNTAFGEDLLKKIPAIDFEKPVNLKPYSFTDDKGKSRRGITIIQDGEKVLNYYRDGEKSVNGLPQPDEKTKEKNKPDLWKMYYDQVRIFMTEQVEENHCFGSTEPTDETDLGDVDNDEQF